ncbi:MAG: ABC transporter ATP-binding protein [Bradymonadaceae bacterium]
MIEVRNITKFHGDQRVLDDVSFTVPEETYLGLVGPGGAGKSLMLKIVCGLVEPDSGAVVVDGQHVHDLDVAELADLRMRMGMLFQNYALFDSMTVAENIAFPMRQAGDADESEIERRVGSILDEIGLPRAGSKFPGELSGGMKKRVSFARAVIRRPKLLFYDDPSAGLDPVTASKIFELLETLKREYRTTAITVSHNIDGIRDVSDRVVMLDAGSKRFEGPVDEVADSSDPRVRDFWSSYAVDAEHDGRAAAEVDR